MKIAFISPGFVPVPDVMGGAIERLMTYLIEQNEIENKLEIDLYTVDHPDLNNFNFKKTNINKIKLNKIEGLFDRFFNHYFWKYNIELSFSQFGRKTLKKMRNTRYDYILVENNMYIYKKIYLKITKKFPETRFIYHLHNDIGKVDKPISLCKYILSTASKVITCSEYLKNRLNDVKRTGKVNVLYNVIDFENLKFDHIGRQEIRKKYNIEDNFIYGYIGRISQEKGVLELVRAFKNIYKNNKDLRLMIIGDTLFKNTGNKYYNEIKNEVDEISDAIIFTGSVDNKIINKYMSSLDVLVIPTICEEAFGIVAAEGLACEIPLLATKSGGMVEILDEESALLINKENIIENLEKGMMQIKENYEEYKNKTKNGRKKIIKKQEFHCNKYLNNFFRIVKLHDK